MADGGDTYFVCAICLQKDGQLVSCVKQKAVQSQSEAKTGEAMPDQSSRQVKGVGSGLHTAHLGRPSNWAAAKLASATERITEIAFMLMS